MKKMQPPSLDTYYLLRRRICEYENECGINLMEKCFEQLTRSQISTFKISAKSVRMDSKLIGSNIARYSRFELIYNTLRKFIAGLGETGLISYFRHINNPIMEEILLLSDFLFIRSIQNENEKSRMNFFKFKITTF